MGAVSDGWDDHSLVKKSGVRESYTLGGITQDLESGNCGHSFFGKEVDMVFEQSHLSRWKPSQ